MKGELLKNNNKGMSLVIMLMLIAVFSVFIVGTYAILDRHIVRTTYSEDEQGAYYVAESVLKLSSTQIDRMAYDISNEYNEQQKVLTKDQFITELDARVASNQDIFLSAVQDEFSEYSVNRVYVLPNETESETYTRLYDITAFISNERKVDNKKVTGTYGVIYLTESSQSSSTSVMIINESTPMLTALEDVSADASCSLNGNAILKGTFSYPGHYDPAVDPVHFFNNDKTYEVDTSSLVRNNVKIPTIPDPPYSGNPNNISFPDAVGNAPVSGDIYSANSGQTLDLPFWGHPYYPAERWIERKDYVVHGTKFYITGRSYTINVNADDCYIVADSLIMNNDLIINTYGDNFRIRLNNQILCQRNGRMIVNTNGHDVFIVASNLKMEDDVENITIETTGTGNVYLFFNGFFQPGFNDNNYHNLNLNVKNESNVNMVILGGHIYVNWGTYSNITFNCEKPAGVTDAGIVNFFVAQDEFGIKARGSMTFNAEEGTHLNIIADKLVMNGDLKIEGEASVNIYARQSCDFNGNPDDYSTYPSMKYLSNYPFNDEDMTENEKAQKIVDTKLNIYYYGSSALKISNYMCCANFYSAKEANIIINNSSFYGNIFSSAPAPEEGEDRHRIDFNNSYISCGAIYAPRMNINISGDAAYPYKRTTDEGIFSSCVFAAATGYNINFRGSSMIKSSDIIKQSMELIVEMEFTPGVVAVGDSYSGSHFSRGFTIE
ncbi:MAG: hypothetical protein IJS80_06540 [Lachnospiraceae bacterium]|nr:hypothetical protein [Lachnospiraceae bacterium]